MRFVPKGLLDPESLGGPSPSTAAGAPRPSASSGSRGRRIPVRPCAKAPEGSQGRRRLGMSSRRESRGTASLPRDSPASAAGVCISPSLRISANAGPRKSGSQLPGRLCVYWLPRKKKKKKFGDLLPTSDLAQEEISRNLPSKSPHFKSLCNWGLSLSLPLLSPVTTIFQEYNVSRF